MTAPRVIQDRRTWGAVAWIVVGLLASLGVLYLTGGIHAAPTSKAYEVILVAGDLRVHGGVLLTLAALLVAGLVPPLARKPYRHRYVRVALIAASAYEAWVVYAFLAAWRLNGTNTAAPALWWTAGLALSVVLIVCSPRPNRTTAGRATECTTEPSTSSG